MKKVSIVVLHYKGKKFTAQCLTSIKKLQTKGFKVETIVVNNNPQENLKDLEKRFSGFTSTASSPDEIGTQLRRRRSRKAGERNLSAKPKSSPEISGEPPSLYAGGGFIFLETGENLGFTGGNNFGIKRALKNGADYVFLINNDTTLDPEVLISLVKVAEKKKKAGLFSPMIYFAPNYEYHHDRYQKSERGKVIWYAGGEIDWANVIIQHRGVDEVDKKQYDQVEETDYISGCGMLIKKEVFEKIGFLDEKYFLYYEDSSFSLEAKKDGFQLLFVPQAKMWHFNAESSEVGGSLQDYYIARNRLLFGLRYAPLRAKFALFRWGLSRLIIGRPWQKIGFRDFLINKFGKGSYEA